MRNFTLASLLLTVVAGHAVLPGSSPTNSVPAATNQASPSNLEDLDLRQAAVLPAGVASTSTTTLLPAGVAPIPTTTKTKKTTLAPPIAVIPPTTTSAPSIPLGEENSVTVQWIETWIGTSRTWVPVTITVKFIAVPSQLPGPGKGVIGMGTLTGDTGVTKTVVVGAGPTMGVDRLLGSLAVVGAVWGLA
ncbi:hypothetical protein BDV96DRAFT_650040 [Lophiotrema nucula]|uniref:Uncharacterized protein n=1 Tax=Lophiotrema nucula TaxID=690887 RepID=A0A6A5YWH2_9PLEO|nr:hypothetical protein BDV96DRAFT_650040 [Lophiotrema nucula]